MGGRAGGGARSGGGGGGGLQAALRAKEYEIAGAKVENMLRDAKPADRFQFLRLGYFCADSKDSKPGALVFNRAVSLKDSFKPGK